MLLLSSSSLWAIEVYDFKNQQQRELYQELTQELRCLVCQNQNLADSDADLAKDLKNQVADFVMNNQDKDTILAYMVQRYGDFVTYNPPLNAGTFFLWFSPFIVLLIGAVILIFNIRKKKQ
ncbi:cytochrome c-type biogenesis protein [Marinicella gelatinilytica]|uniref:cytochrome c-type biogenesis protein n=1 Tax=Marinicella gelatinilytica TaxID=2996017 RepID=UPI002260EE19|nr:cytochrome c-type biogenesis protein [Marinicella gelatinilytica]MCX7543965.1 cytochrome c-type biogenesis protein CcmH [Marinicella gelatinilytica]